jgi:hypothetical protein
MFDLLAIGVELRTQRWTVRAPTSRAARDELAVAAAAVADDR